jgi:DNA-binding GntR family transcriptional regulator
VGSAADRLAGHTRLIGAASAWQSGQVKGSGKAVCIQDENERIVDCIAKGDAEGAVKLMDQHLRELEEHLMLESPGDEKSLAKLLGLG